MNLSDVLTQLVAERAISEITVAQYRRSIARLGDYLKRQPTTGDLNYQTINGYLAWLENDCKLSAVSVRNHRIGIICVWNYCVYPLEILPMFLPRRLRCPRIDRKPINAWSMPDVSHLLRAASQVPGKLRSGLPANLLLQAWIRLGTETGLRPSDLRELTWKSVDFASQSIAICQHKTGDQVVVRFSSETATCLRQIMAYSGDTVFPIGKTGFWKWEQRLYQLAAAIGFVRRPGQGIGTLRKTHATEVYRKHGASASAESLGHRSGNRIALDHYIDSRARKTYIVPVDTIADNNIRAAE